MKTFYQFIEEAYSKDTNKRYHPLPKGRMDRRAAKTAAIGAGHLGIAAGAIGAENVVGEVGDLPDEIARASIERSIDPLRRASKIIKTRMTHSPEASQEREASNRKKGKDKGKEVNEDIEQLKRGLETLERQSAPKERLAARRRAALERTRQIHKAEKQRQREYKEAQARKKRRDQNEELQLEQTPHMTPTPFNIMKAREQAKGGIKHRVHVHQEIGAEARAQQTAKRARMKAIMSR